MYKIGLLSCLYESNNNTFWSFGPEWNSMALSVDTQHRSWLSALFFFQVLLLTYLILPQWPFQDLQLYFVFQMHSSPGHWRDTGHFKHGLYSYFRLFVSCTAKLVSVICIAILDTCKTAWVLTNSWKNQHLSFPSGNPAFSRTEENMCDDISYIHIS